jgi:hypothetical protein
MRPRVVFGTAVAILSGLLGGCRGDFTYDRADATGTSDGDPSTGDGDGVGDNLLGNPSFDLWTGQDLVVWSVQNATVTQSNEAVDGDFSATVDGADYSSLGQYLTFPDPLPAGTCLRGGATIRWLGGSNIPPGFLFTASYADETEELHGNMLPWIADGEWHEGQIAQVELPKDTTLIAIALGNTTADPQIYGIDAAWFRVEPCE